MVFHSPQPGQRPTHLGLLEPQAWQTYKVFDRVEGMRGIVAASTDDANKRSNKPCSWVLGSGAKTSRRHALFVAPALAGQFRDGAQRLL